MKLADQVEDFMDSKVVMPSRLTAENGAKALLSGEWSEWQRVSCPRCLQEGFEVHCEVCGGDEVVNIKVPVTWTTIKEIYAKVVSEFGVKVQEAE